MPLLPLPPLIPRRTLPQPGHEQQLPPPMRHRRHTAPVQHPLWQRMAPARMRVRVLPRAMA
jgi:hypothetical protein